MTNQKPSEWRSPSQQESTPPNGKLCVQSAYRPITALLRANIYHITAQTNDNVAYQSIQRWSELHWHTWLQSLRLAQSLVKCTEICESLFREGTDGPAILLVLESIVFSVCTQNEFAHLIVQIP